LQGCIIGLREHDATEIFDAHTHTSLGLIGSSEEMIEIDFANGKVNRVGDSMASSASCALRRTDRRGISSLSMPATQAVRSGVPSDVMRMVRKDTGRHPWAAQLLTSKSAQIATVTFANKTARIA